MIKSWSVVVPKMNQLMGNPSHVSWGIAIISALMGTFSHVFLDSIMHADVEPYFPITGANGMYGFISMNNLEKFCLYSGFGWRLVYFMLVIFLSRKGLVGIPTIICLISHHDCASGGSIEERRFNQNYMLS